MGRLRLTACVALLIGLLALRQVLEQRAAHRRSVSQSAFSAAASQAQLRMRWQRARAAAAARCADKSEHCGSWRDGGACLSNAQFMLIKCAKSCTECAAAEAAATAGAAAATAPAVTAPAAAGVVAPAAAAPAAAATPAAAGGEGGALAGFKWKDTTLSGGARAAPPTAAQAAAAASASRQFIMHEGVDLPDALDFERVRLASAALCAKHCLTFKVCSAATFLVDSGGARGDVGGGAGGGGGDGLGTCDLKKGKQAEMRRVQRAGSTSIFVGSDSGDAAGRAAAAARAAAARAAAAAAASAVAAAAGAGMSAEERLAAKLRAVRNDPSLCRDDAPEYCKYVDL